MPSHNGRLPKGVTNPKSTQRRQLLIFPQADGTTAHIGTLKTAVRTYMHYIDLPWLRIAGAHQYLLALPESLRALPLCCSPLAGPSESWL